MMNINTKRMFFRELCQLIIQSHAKVLSLNSHFSLFSLDILGLTIVKHDSIMKNNRQGAAENKEE